ncbi:MAG: hypothetical protein IT198_04800 [Acidimicrobiia bacterium]|nr:hypothetical protein [Acidimicrobiia bacterium]
MEDFETLISTGDFAQAAALLERKATWLLGHGQLVELRVAVASLPRRHRSLLLRVADADAAARTHTIDLAAFDALVDEAAHQDDELGRDLHALACATKAQYLLWRGDPQCAAVAVPALAALPPPEDLTSPLGLVARARLNVVVAVAEVMLDASGNRGDIEARLDTIVADFNRAGYAEEGLAWLVCVHTLLAGHTWERLPETAELVSAAAQRLAARGSGYFPLACVGEAMLWFLSGDVWRSFRALEAAEAGATSLPMVEGGVRYVRLVARLLREGPSGAVDDAIDDLVSGLDKHAPELANSALSTFAHLHADVGDMPRAARLDAWSRHQPQPQPDDPVGLRVLDGRLQAAGGDPVGGLETVKAAARALGSSRAAHCQLARAARTFDLIGEPAMAEELRTAAASALGAPQTLWEMLLVRKPPGPEDPGSPAREVMVRALAPDITVDVDGRSVPLGNLHARIVGSLVAADRPLSAEELIDRVWGEDATTTVRKRLGVALHRLRAVVDAEIVIRDPKGVRLASASEGVTSDVAALLAADPAELVSATEAVRGYEDDFAVRQLAYDDWAIETRRWLRARWVHLATRVLRRALETDPHEVLDIALQAHRFAADEPELAVAAADVLDATSRPGEASAIRAAATATWTD